MASNSTEKTTTRARPGYTLVTGGAGFIGSHTTESLLARGHRVVVLDDFSTGRRSNLAKVIEHENLRVIEARIEHGLLAPLAEVEAEWGKASGIVHLAAQTSVVASVANPLQDCSVNYHGTLQVMEFARIQGVSRVVFASSAAVYGDSDKLPIDESQAQWPIAPYGVHKLGGEQLLACYAQVHGISSIATRFFNVYGPRQDPASPYSGVISIFIDRALRSLPIGIFGDGSQSRDFVYVADIVKILVESLEKQHEGHVSVNIGTGRSTTVADLARRIQQICGGGSDIVHHPARAGEIRASLADVSRLREQWQGRADTELGYGLEKTIQWCREQN